MHSDEIKKALFPKDVMIDDLKAENAQLTLSLEKYITDSVRYNLLKEMGVVLTGEGDGALYLQGEEMDEWFKTRPKRFGDAPVMAEGQAVLFNTKPRKKK